MNCASIDQIFSKQIYPEFPFRNEGWLAVAFERNSYDNTRMPEVFFRVACETFNPDRDKSLIICGDCFSQNEESGRVVRFDWQSYRQFMLSPGNYSLEYKMIGSDGSCGCWADPELTVFGGETERMLRLLQTFGGKEEMLRAIENEFFLGDSSGNEEMLDYFRSLLYPENRVSAC